MADMLKIMEQRLTEEDKNRLKGIYEPQIVSKLYKNAWSTMCVMPDGEIRHYGEIIKVYGQHESYGKSNCYISSKDCGLSWKLYDITNPKSITSAGRIECDEPFYIDVDRSVLNEDVVGGAGYLAFNFAKSPDDEPYKSVRICNVEKANCFKHPFLLNNKNRIITVIDLYEKDEGVVHISHPVIIYSDDMGDTWSLVDLKKSPQHEAKFPHKGARWENSCVEPTLVELSDGTLMLVVRTSQDYHYKYYSYDHGTTWTDPEPTDFHATLTMPTLFRMSDGRILFFWCNTQPLPELDHEEMGSSDVVKTGYWEDVFTNRDAVHCAVSYDDGKTWKGFRELRLSDIRNNADFRSYGGKFGSNDKSVHQHEVMELPFGKILLASGQHDALRRMIIFDPDWLLETERSEDFMCGMINVSTQMYVKSCLESKAGCSGHCSYNRTNGALLIPDPYNDGYEVLQICRVEDERLVEKKQGMAWNFPAAKKGEVDIFVKVLESGVKISLLEMWMNPCDPYVDLYSNAHLDVTKDMTEGDGYTKITLKWNCDNDLIEFFSNGDKIGEEKLQNRYPNGLSYLHIQTLAESEDYQGTLIKGFCKR